MAGKITPLRALMEWRRYVRTISEAAKTIIPKARIYVAGGAAEGRLTVVSDVDVLVVLPYEVDFEEATELHAKILEEAERLELPPYAPVEFHIISDRELKEYARRGKVIPANKI